MLKDDSDFKMTVSQVLENVSNGEFPCWWFHEIGICNQDWNYCTDFTAYGTGREDGLFDIFSKYWEEWDEYSGNIHYPVSSSNNKSPYEEYDDGITYYDLAYGESRKRLAGFLSKKLKEV